MQLSFGYFHIFLGRASLKLMTVICELTFKPHSCITISSLCFLDKCLGGHVKRFAICDVHDARCAGSGSDLGTSQTQGLHGRAFSEERQVGYRPRSMHG